MNWYTIYGEFQVRLWPCVLLILSALFYQNIPSQQWRHSLYELCRYEGVTSLCTITVCRRLCTVTRATLLTRGAPTHVGIDLVWLGVGGVEIRNEELLFGERYHALHHLPYNPAVQIVQCPPGVQYNHLHKYAETISLHHLYHITGYIDKVINTVACL